MDDGRVDLSEISKKQSYASKITFFITNHLSYMKRINHNFIQLFNQFNEIGIP